MKKTLRAFLSTRKSSIVYRIIRWCQRQPEWAYSPPPPYVCPDVQKALRLAPDLIKDPQESQSLKQHVFAPDNPGIDSRSLFYLSKDNPLPCWQDSDLTYFDGWLEAPNYYPIYYSIFQRLTSPERRVRFLEIGVRTGYIGVVAARASRGPLLYVGVDPNLYVGNGLDLAAASFRALRNIYASFDYLLTYGYSSNQDVQKTLAYSGPFDIIHIDGEHTVQGKLVDLDLARRIIAPNGCILVDDFDHHSIVADAVKRALTLNWFSEFAYVPTFRGLGVLRC